MSSPLFARAVRQPELGPRLRAEMLALMRVCYEGVTPERFAADLGSKHHVILLFVKGSRRLAGFSTLRIATDWLEGRPVDLAYTGDTVLHPDYWGTKTLQTAVVGFLFGLKLRHPHRRCLWLLLSGGYKTYLMLANYLPVSFPNRRYEPTAERRRFLERVGTRWFGKHYDAELGVVRFGADHYRVRSGLAPVDTQTARNPDVAFFVERNPGHASGDELVCLAEFRMRDFVRILTRLGLAQARFARREVRQPLDARAGS